VRRHAIHRRRHAELPDTPGDVVPGNVTGSHGNRCLGAGQVGPGEVRRPAEQFRQSGRKGIEYILRGLARGLGGGVADNPGQRNFSMGWPGSGQLPGHAAVELDSERRVVPGVRGKEFAPLLFQAGTQSMGVPARTDLVRNHEGRCRPAQKLAGRGGLFRAQSLPVHLFRALLVGGAPANDSLAADQGGAGKLVP
jgi:hypothetical protein